jgi:hypothetical protein
LIDWFNQQSDAAAGRYLTVIQGFRGAYGQAFTGPLMKPSAIDSLSGGLYGIARIYLPNEQGEIARASEWAAFKAQENAFNDLGVSTAFYGYDDDTSELLSASQQHLSDEIAVQLERDIAFTKQSLRRARLQVGIAARTQGIDQQTAKVQHLIDGRNELKFQFTDRGGRRWPSHKFIRQAWRHHLLTTYNDAYMATAAEYGVSQFEIDHPSGARFSTLPGGALPSYDEVKDQIFHPNSVTLVRVVSQS